MTSLYQASRLMDLFDAGGAAWGDHHLNKREFTDMLSTAMGREVPRGLRNMLGRMADTNGDGKINTRELRNFINRMQSGDMRNMMSPDPSQMRDLKQMLKELIRMMGGDPNGVNCMQDLEDMLKDLQGGDCGGGKRGGGCGSPGGYSPPAGNCGSGGGGGRKSGCGIPKPKTVCDYKPPKECDKEKKECDKEKKSDANPLLANRGELRKVMNQESSRDVDTKMSREEMKTMFNTYNTEARVKSGNDANIITNDEQNKIFDRFDTSKDGQLNDREQLNLRNYMVGGNWTAEKEMRLDDWNRMRQENPA